VKRFTGYEKQPTIECIKPLQRRWLLSITSTICPWAREIVKKDDRLIALIRISEELSVRYEQLVRLRAELEQRVGGPPCNESKRRDRTSIGLLD
jgi:hypothetical protein